MLNKEGLSKTTGLLQASVVLLTLITICSNLQALQRTGITDMSFPLQQPASFVKSNMIKIGLMDMPEETLNLEYSVKERAYFQILEKDLLPYFKQKNIKSPTCFISYAWGDPYHEFWVRRFSEMLAKAGINIYLDRWSIKKGNILNEFVRKIEDADWVIVVGTKLYLQKYNKRAENPQDKEHVARLEGQLVEYLVRYSTEKGNKVIPILLEGTSEESLPFMLRHKIASEFTKNDYFEELLKLIRDLYNIDNRDKYFESVVEQFRRYSLATAINISEAERESFVKKQTEKIKKYDKEVSEDINRFKKEVFEKSSYLGVHNFSDKSNFLLTSQIEANQPISWNLPRQDHLFVGRENLLGDLNSKLHTNKENSKPNKSLIVSVCAGLGGVGKTQLALQYIHYPKHSYTLRAWFASENIDQLRQQYIEFAKILGYREENPSIKTALPYIKEWFSEHPGWLLVYDNVGSYEEIKEFLPEIGGSIILTTRHQKWPSGFNTLDIDVMEEEEAIKLIQSLIRRNTTEAEKQAVKELVKMLGYLPLALAQASAYIWHNQITIVDYLNLYKSHEQELLADKTLPEGANSLPVAVTWNISLEAIIKEAKVMNQPPLALDLLSACAYLVPERIPHNLLLTWLKNSYPHLVSPELILPKLIGQLWKYSMIHSDENGDVTVHRLVQAAVRQQHKQVLSRRSWNLLPLTLDWYNMLITSAHNEFQRKTQVLEDEMRQKNLLPHLQMLLNHYKKIWPDDSEFSLSQIISDIGKGFYVLGEIKNSKSYYERALLILEQQYYKDHPQTAEILMNLGEVYRALGDFEQAKVFHERTLTIKESYYGNNHFEIASTLDYLGNAYRNLGNAKQAKVFHERALAIKESYYGNNHFEIASTLDQLGRDYKNLGDLKQAKRLHERALKIKEAYYGKDHIAVAFILDHLGRVCRELGDAKQAKEFHERALKMKETYYGKNHVQMAFTLDQLGRDYRDLGNAKQAKELHERALKIGETYYRKNHITVAFTLDHLGRVYRDLGDAKQAKVFHERALAIKESYYGTNHFEVAFTLDHLGKIYRELGKAKEAKKFHERALKIKETYYGKDHIEMASTLDQLGKDCEELGYMRQAKVCLKRALVIRKNSRGE